MLLRRMQAEQTPLVMLLWPALFLVSGGGSSQKERTILIGLVRSDIHRRSPLITGTLCVLTLGARWEMTKMRLRFV